METVKRIIKFNEELHRYTDEDNNVYTSVTQTIQKVTPVFNEDYWAKYKANQAGVTVAQIKQNWKDIRQASCDKGNKTHKTLEDSINEANGKANFEFDKAKVRITTEFGLEINQTNLHILANSPLAIKYPAIYNYLKYHIEQGWTLYAEKRIYWYEYLIAGTIDCLLIKGKHFIIVDWKTNKDILKFISGYYKKVNGIKTDQWVNKKEYMLEPLGHLEHCKGTIYTIQLSLYAHLLELWGFKCIHLCLFHILNDKPQLPYTIKYLENEVITLANNFKGLKNQSKIEQFGQNLYNQTLKGLSSNSTIKTNTNFGIK